MLIAGGGRGHGEAEAAEEDWQAMLTDAAARADSAGPSASVSLLHQALSLTSVFTSLE